MVDINEQQEQEVAAAAAGGVGGPERGESPGGRLGGRGFGGQRKQVRRVLVLEAHAKGGRFGKAGSSSGWGVAVQDWGGHSTCICAEGCRPEGEPEAVEESGRATSSSSRWGVLGGRIEWLGG
jgi:hypothetical protein